MSGQKALEKVLEACGADGGAADKLESYVALLLQHNRASNLIGPLPADKVRSELIADALLPAAVRPPIGPLMDIGSGAGLPGIPLAIAFPHTEVHLVEPRQKRTTFLKIVTRRLGLDNVHVHVCRIEEVGLAASSFGTMAAKAFRPPAEFIAEAAAWRRRGDGQIYLYLSESSWDDAARQAARDAGLIEAGRFAHPDHPDRFGLVLAEPQGPEDAS